MQPPRANFGEPGVIRTLPRVATVERVRLAYNNLYLVEDADELVVIDTGPDYHGAREIILHALAGRVPVLVVATHGHLDHAGLGGWWHARGVPVLLGAEDLAYARGTDFEFEPLARYVETCGAPPLVAAEAVDGLRQRLQWHDHLRHAEGWAPSRDGRWPTQLRYAPFEPDRLVDADIALPAGLALRIAPGHTPGNLVVVHDNERWLFSGDQLLPDITPTPAIQFHNGERFASLPRFLDSMRALRDGAFVRCFPGHGEPFEDVSVAVAANLSQAEDRAARLLEALRHGGPATPYEAAERLYPRALRRRFWQIIATVQGHLDVLAEAGTVAFDGQRWSMA